MGARSTRPNIGRDHGSFWAHEIRVDHTAAEREAAIGIQAQTPPPVQLVAHPVVATRHDQWFRVIREYRTSQGILIEDIGEAPTFDAALAIAKSEIGRARVLSPWSRGKVRSLYDNLQPIEDRS